jgi:hypothetical protein
VDLPHAVAVAWLRQGSEDTSELAVETAVDLPHAVAVAWLRQGGEDTSELVVETAVDLPAVVVVWLRQGSEDTSELVVETAVDLPHAGDGVVIPHARGSPSRRQRDGQHWAVVAARGAASRRRGWWRRVRSRGGVAACERSRVERDF